MESPDEGFPTVNLPNELKAFQILPQSRRQRPESTSRPKAADHNVKETAQSIPLQLPSKGRNEKQKVRPGSYQAMGLNSEICKALSNAGYGFPTPIQRKVIPCILSGNDVVAMARTGSGKTAAFLVPILHRLAESPLRMSTATKQNGPRVLVVAPTRELVIQTLKFCRLYSKLMRPAIRSAVVVGGTPLESQFEALAVCPDIIFATPGRLLQILAEMGPKGGLTLSTAETVVFDEADRLFEGTLAVETASLLANLRNRSTESMENRQTILVSATMPHALAEFSRSGLRKSLSVVRLDADKGLSPTLAVSFISTRGDKEKDATLQFIVRRITGENQTLVVFAGTHRRVEYLTQLLRKCIHCEVSCIHGNMDQLARIEAVSKFRKRITKVLVVTDVAARGIDLPDLDAVVNYDTPATPKLFIHRVGRVGRAGRFGLAFNLVTNEEVPYMLDVFLFVGREITFAENNGAQLQSDPFRSHAFAIESSFVIGGLPKNIVDEEVETISRALEDFDLKKAHQSAKNAHGLYSKTRGVASGESVRRGKELMATSDGGRRIISVHPWFTNMETNIEHRAAEEAYRLSTWRPKECAVKVPTVLGDRKTFKEEAQMKNNMESPSNGEDGVVTQGSISEPASIIQTTNDMSGNVITTTRAKLSARQIALEEERKQFFLPATQDTSRKHEETALKVGRGGSMGNSLRAFKELQDAAMDLTADINSDLLRSKHTGSSTAKYWDRVSKKFVKGGVTSTTSKRNLHVATREAKARANGGNSYGSGDGVMFKKWLAKNRKAVEQLAERVDEGAQSNGSRSTTGLGLGSKDFRKGAFGRRSRIAALGRNRESMSGADPKSQQSTKSELKSTAEIKKMRKWKAKADSRRAKKPGKGNNRGKNSSQGMARVRPSKTRMVVRRK